MENLRKLLICESNRIVEILESDELQTRGYCKEWAELACKMKEFRRDSVRLEKMMYDK